MANYTLTNKAVEDLSNIWNYTVDAWSEKQADKYYNMLIGFCSELCLHPEKGKRYEEVETALLGYKAGRHIIFYKVLNPKQIAVIRILHERMDLKSRLQE